VVGDFLRDQVARVLLQPHVAVARQLEQFAIGVERLVLVLERFPQDVADVVLVRLQQRPDAEAGVTAQPGDQFAGLAGMVQPLLRLLAQPIPLVVRVARLREPAGDRLAIGWRLECNDGGQSPRNNNDSR
jgi:hypothetical protein